KRIHMSRNFKSKEIDESERPKNPCNDAHHIELILHKSRIEKIGQSPRNEGENRRIPDHRIDPLEPNGEHADVFPKSRAYPMVNPPLFGKCGGELSCN